MATPALQKRARELAQPRPRGRVLYFEDVGAWAEQQAAALRNRDLDAVDWDNVIEEIEELGTSREHAWVSSCARAIEHLLAIEHSAAQGDRGHWRDEILEFRDVMRKNLGGKIKGHWREFLAEAWEDGRRYAVRRMTRYDVEAGVGSRRVRERFWKAALPAECPYALFDIAGYDIRAGDGRPDDDVWPAAVAERLNELPDENYPVKLRPPDRGPGRGGGFSR